MLNGVPATSDQMNSMLDQLTTGLSNTTELLNRTKDALGAVENKLTHFRQISMPSQVRLLIRNCSL